MYEKGSSAIFFIMKFQKMVFYLGLMNIARHITGVLSYFKHEESCVLKLSKIWRSDKFYCLEKQGSVFIIHWLENQNRNILPNVHVHTRLQFYLRCDIYGRDGTWYKLICRIFIDDDWNLTRLENWLWIHKSIKSKEWFVIAMYTPCCTDCGINQIAITIYVYYPVGMFP